MADLTITAVWSIIIEIQFGSAVKGDTMNVTRIISIMLGLIAAVLIAMAGRSCAKDITEKNKERRQRNTTEAPSYHLITDPPIMSQPGDVQFTNDEEMPSLIVESTSQVITDPPYEIVTNLLGEVVETIPVTTPEEALIPTTTLGILEAYNALHPVETQPVSDFEPGTVAQNIVIEIN